MAMLLVVSVWVGASPSEVLKNTPAGLVMTAQKMPLEEFLERLSRSGPVQWLAVPELARQEVEMSIEKGQTVDSVIRQLHEKYGWQVKMNHAKTALIVMKGAFDNGIYWGGVRTAPSLAMRESSKIAPAIPPPMVRPPVPWNTEEYRAITDNRFQDPNSRPLSTFSVDVDTASYSIVRRFLNEGTLPPADAVRTEEMINYFRYDYSPPLGEDPVSITTEMGDCPWNPAHKLVLLGLQARKMDIRQLPPANLVFLVDVSGSMSPPNRLPLVKTALKMLVQQLRPQDRISIVVYAGAAGLVLDSTPGNEKALINAKIDSLQAGGSTAGGAGIQLAYKVAKERFVSGGNNRVILATDGDFNVGVSSEGELARLIEEKRQDGIYLTVLGFGMGNLKDNKMETLAQKGNGNYAYIDNAQEAKKVLVSQLAGTLYVVAKDVKLQVEFNPAKVKAYRLIGYENRQLADADFNEDKKDAGDMGSGHAVTALYEIVPAESTEKVVSIDSLVFQQNRLTNSTEWLQLKVRYKEPTEEQSRLLARRISGDDFAVNPSDNFRLAAAVAEYGMLLRNSQFKGRATYSQALALIRSTLLADEDGYRAELARMMELTAILAIEP